MLFMMVSQFESDDSQHAGDGETTACQYCEDQDREVGEEPIPGGEIMGSSEEIGERSSSDQTGGKR